MFSWNPKLVAVQECVSGGSMASWGQGPGARKGISQGACSSVSHQELGTAALNSPEGQGVSSRPSLRKIKVVGAEDTQIPRAVAIIGIKENPS